MSGCRITSKGAPRENARGPLHQRTPLARAEGQAFFSVKSIGMPMNSECSFISFGETSPV
jgi:hypothetical protein